MPTFIDRKWKIVDGKIPEFIIHFINNQRGEFELILKKKKKQRSKAFNRYYWVYLTIIKNETGNDENDLHDLFKRLFLNPKEIIVLGKTIKIPGSTTDLNNTEFDEYIRKIEIETGIKAPNPDDLYL